MGRSRLILVAGLVLAVAAYAVLYFSRTSEHRTLHHSGAPELSWLQSQFHLSDDDFARVGRIHEAYLPECARMCARIEAKNQEIKSLVSGTNAVTPALEKALSDAAELRADCHKSMFRYFFKVSQAMPPAEGRRYMQWVQERTLESSHGMADQGWLSPGRR